MMKLRMSVKMGDVESKCRSLGQILEKPFVCSGGYIFHPIIIKLGQIIKFCLDKILHKCGNWSYQSKRRSVGQILEKPCV